MLIWIIGAVTTFAAVSFSGLHNRAVIEIQAIDSSLPLWCIQGAIALGCALLWPVLLAALLIDVVVGWL